MILADYFATLGKFTFVVNLPWIAQQVYNVAYYFLPEFTRNQTIVVTSKQVKEGFLLDHFHPDDLE